MKSLISALLLVLGTSCTFTFPPGTFTEFSRDYCPDSTKFLLKYDYVQGAWDGGRSWAVAIVRNTDNVTEACKKKSFSSHDFDDIYWKNNDTVIIEENFMEFISQGISNLKDTTVNGVTVDVICRDPIDPSFKREIIYQELSPDRQYELVAYRYVKPGNEYNFLNVSVIKKSDTLPKFGNFLISRHDDDCIRDIRWDSAHVLSIGAPSSCYYAFDQYLINNHADIKYNLRLDETNNGNIH